MVSEAQVRYLTYAVVVGLLLYPVFNALIEVLGVTYGPRLTDFDTYYYSAKRFLDGGSLYADSVPPAPNGSSRRFVYPPIAILLFVPFTLLPFTVAGVLWDLTTLALLVGAACLLVRELLRETDRTLTGRQWAVVVAGVVGYAPTVNWLKAGQASGLVAAGLCLSVALLVRERRTGSLQSSVWSGAVIPMVAFVKPYYAPAGGHLLQDRRRFLSAVVAGVVILLVSLVAIGVDHHRLYLENVLLTGGNLVYTTPPGDWNAGVYAPFYALGSVAEPVRIGLVLVTVAGILWLRYHGVQNVEVALFSIALIPMATPTRVDGLVALLPVYVVLLVRYWETWGVRMATLASLALVHVHPYTMELLAKLGPRYLPALEGLAVLLPVLQPALWGHLLLLGLLVSLISPRGAATASRLPFITDR